MDLEDPNTSSKQYYGSIDANQIYLKINIVHAVNLRSADLLDKNDVYVQAYAFPEHIQSSGGWFHTNHGLPLHEEQSIFPANVNDTQIKFEFQLPVDLPPTCIYDKYN